MDTKTINEILGYLCETLGGDWLLTGGSLVRLGFDGNRGTEDVDLVKIRHSQLTDEAAKNALFQWLLQRGLGPEWVNSAVEPFIREVREWEDELILFRSGSLGQIFRPNLTLFTYLKLRRGSDIDLRDIQQALPCCPEGFSEPKFLSWANETLKAKFMKYRFQLGL